MERTTDMHTSTCPRCGSEHTWEADTYFEESGGGATLYQYMFCEECEREYTNAYQLAYQYMGEDEDF